MKIILFKELTAQTICSYQLKSSRIHLCALGKATSSQCEQSHNDNEAHQGNLTNGALYRVLQARRKRRPIVEQLE